MSHPIYRVIAFEIKGPYTLKVTFDDGTEQTIDFRPVVAGPLYGPLRVRSLFEQVKVDPEAHTFVWPNGANFDPETLHNWPKYAEEMKRLAKRWAAADVKTGSSPVMGARPKIVG